MTSPPTDSAHNCAPDERYPIEIDPIYWCWLWQSGLDKDGYGRRKGKLAHRFVYEKEVGPIEDGMVCDHRCRVRACCNPSHIEVVTERENQKRKNWRYLSRMPACKRGHDRHLYGIRTKFGGIVCKLCE